MNALPANLDAERLTLGAVFTTPGAWHAISAALRPEDFSIEKHRRIFCRMTDLAERGENIERISVIDELRRREQLESVDGMGYVMGLDEGLPRIHNLETYVRIVKRKSAQRRLIFSAQALSDRSMTDESDPAEIIASAQRELDEIASDAALVTESGTIGEAVEEIGGLDALFRKPASTIPWPHPTMNSFSNGGIEPDSMWILAARPSTGKSALALETALHAAKRGHPVNFFSLEMGKRKLLLRMLSSETGIPLAFLIGGNLTESERGRIRRTVAGIDNLPLSIFTGHLQLGDIVTRILRDKPRLVIVDYLQLVGTTERHENRTQQVSAISRRLKLIPQQHGIPVLALSQLNRAPVAAGASRLPQLSDLRESGAIEQDADGVVFLHDLDAGKEQKTQGGMVKAYFAKQRDGARDLWLDLKFEGAFVRFRELTRNTETEPESTSEPTLLSA